MVQALMMTPAGKKFVNRKGGNERQRMEGKKMLIFMWLVHFRMK